MTESNRMRPLEAWRALRRLIASPDDTAEAFRVIGALSGNSSERLLARCRRTERGRRLLAERPILAEMLMDQASLRAMPDGTFGRAIGDFFEREQISTDGLVEASVEAYGDRPVAAKNGGANDDLEFLMTRQRDAHDIFHVVTGYGRDIRGELAVLAFTGVQSRNLGVFAIPLFLLFRAGFRSEIGFLIRDGIRRGLRADWFIDQEWEKLLPLGLEAVRERLNLGPLPVYEAVRSVGAPQIPTPV